MYSYVVAVGRNNEMGMDNCVPWYLPNDLKFFRDITMGKPMIMGRKTFESLPKVLPGRDHIVLTRNKEYKFDHPQVTVVYSLDELLELTNEDREYAVIGGCEIFRILLPYTERIYLTEIDESFEADVFFDVIDKENWEVVDEWEGILDEKNTFSHIFYILEKKNKS